jgi:hypothetical protein
MKIKTEVGMFFQRPVKKSALFQGDDRVDNALLNPKVTSFPNSILLDLSKLLIFRPLRASKCN